MTSIGRGAHVGAHRHVCRDGVEAGLVDAAADRRVLLDQFGWSKTALSFGYSLQPVQSGLLGPVQGWMIDHWGPRRVMRTGMLMFGSGFILFSRIDSLLQFYGVFILMAVGSSLAGFMSITTTLVQWFERRRATAMSLSLSLIHISEPTRPY